MPDGRYILTGVITKEANGNDISRVQLFNETRKQIYWLDIDVVIPVLRPLKSMTAEERSELIMIVHYEPKAYEVAYLLKNGFDLFGLHAAGLCVYENEVK